VKSNQDGSVFQKEAVSNISSFFTLRPFVLFFLWVNYRSARPLLETMKKACLVADLVKYFELLTPLKFAYLSLHSINMSFC